MTLVQIKGELRVCFRQQLALLYVGEDACTSNYSCHCDYSKHYKCTAAEQFVNSASYGHKEIFLQHIDIQLFPTC